MEKAESSPRVLVVGVDWMGDAILSTPVLRAIRKAYSACYLAITTPHRLMEIFESNPYVDRVISFEEGLFLPAIVRHLRFLVEIRRERFDTAVCLHRSGTRVFLTFLAGISRRLGFANTKMRFLLTERTAALQADEHRSQVYLDCLKPLGIESSDLRADIVVRTQDRRMLASLVRGTPLEESPPYAVIHPGGNWELKRWPAGYFCEIVDYLSSKKMISVICGTSDEISLAESIRAGVKAGSALSLCGKTSIGVLAALMEKSRVVLSNDSGPIHIAAGLGVPLVGLYGPTAAALTGAKARGPHRLLEGRVGCRVPCYFEYCSERACMEKIRPAEVVGALGSLGLDTAK